tara:strand:+ start:12085 stop:13410 length:1326 start_codon:yes stop_codon:yes gene_type:complete
MANTIQVKRHSTYNESKNPTSNQLAEGELGWNNHGGRLWIGKKTSGSNVDAYEVNPTATASVKGLASFDATDFAVTGGAVSIAAMNANLLTGTINNARLSSIPASALAGSIGNSKLSNNSITIGGTATALGGTITDLTALTDLDLTAGNKTIFDGVGSSTLTIGASGTTIKIAGDLTVEGDTTTINTATLTVEDDVIEISSGNDSRANADGSGIKIPCSGADSDITLGWQSSTASWYSPENIKSNNQVIASGGNSSQWNTAYSDRMKWDGGATGLNAATARASLDLEIGTDVQAVLTFGIASGNALKVDGSPNDNEYARFTATGLEGRTAAELKSDLGLGGLADASTVNNGNWSGTDLAVANGGTGASDATTARTNLGVTASWVQNNHASYNSFNITTTGKEVIQTVTVNNTGHVTNVTKRTTNFLDDDDTIDGGTVTWTN